MTISGRRPECVVRCNKGHRRGSVVLEVRGATVVRGSEKVVQCSTDREGSQSANFFKTQFRRISNFIYMCAPGIAGTLQNIHL